MVVWRGRRGPFSWPSSFAICAERLVVIVPEEKEAGTWLRDLTFFLDDGEAFLLPSWDLLTTDMFAFQRETELSRLEVLHRLLYGEPARGGDPRPRLMQKSPRGRLIEGYAEWISVGDTRERDELARKLTEGGYGRVSLVEGRGEFSVRGNVVDLFPPMSRRPLRLEFFGDELESIREFDEASQRSVKELAEFQLFPAREVILTAERRERAVRNIRRRSNELELPRGTKEKLAEMIATGLGSWVNPLFHPLFYDTARGRRSRRAGGWAPSSTTSRRDGLFILDDPLAIGQAEEKIENDLDRFLLKARTEERFHLEKESAFLTAAEVGSVPASSGRSAWRPSPSAPARTTLPPVRFFLERAVAADIAGGRPSKKTASSGRWPRRSGDGSARGTG